MDILSILVLEPEYPFSPSIKHLVYIGIVRGGETDYNFFKRFDEYKNLRGNSNSSLRWVLKIHFFHFLT
jgi:hypothetical protein